MSLGAKISNGDVQVGPKAFSWQFLLPGWYSGLVLEHLCHNLFYVWRNPHGQGIQQRHCILWFLCTLYTSALNGLGLHAFQGASGVPPATLGAGWLRPTWATSPVHFPTTLGATARGGGVVWHGCPSSQAHVTG